MADSRADSRPAPVPKSIITASTHQLRPLTTHQTARATQEGTPRAQHSKARLLSNKTHYSPTDPEARISIKLGKARALNYRCSVAVDTAQGMISHVQAEFADSRDSVYLPTLTQRTQQRLTANELRLQDLLVDASDSTSSNYPFLEQRGITPWIPVFGKYKLEIEGFPYAAAADHFTYPADKQLALQKYATDANDGWQKIYRAVYQDCKHCPHKLICVPKSHCRQIMRTTYDPAYQRAWARQRSPQGQRLKRLIHTTVEPVFGSLIYHYELRRIGMRGTAGAHKAMQLVAMAFNVKKLIKYQPAQHLSRAVALPLPPPPPARR